MRPLSNRLALAFVLCASAIAGSCSLARLAHLPESGGEIRVRARPGGRYVRTEGDSIAILRLEGCAPTPDRERGHGYAYGRRPTVVRNPLGDALEIPADSVARGTHVKIARLERSYRAVAASAHHAKSPRLTIDLRGCADPRTMTVVHWTGRHWVDVGGTVRDSAITVELPHLSIYVVAGGVVAPPEDPRP